MSFVSDNADIQKALGTLREYSLARVADLEYNTAC